MSDTEATNPAADDTTLVDQQGVDEAEAQDEDPELSEDGDAEGDGPSEDDSEEVEYEGAKYRVPKALKDAVLRQADYTRKTQEVAEQRKALEAEKAQQAEAFEALKVDYARVTALEAQAKAFQDVDWDAWEAQDEASARRGWRQYERLKIELQDAKNDLSEKETARLQEQQSRRDHALEETGKVLARDIKDWSPQVAEQIATIATSEFGVTMDELRGLTDPRIWKLFNEVRVLRSAQKTQATVQRHEKAAAVQPAKTVAGKSGTFKPGLDDSLPADVWLQRRNAQLAKRA